MNALMNAIEYFLGSMLKYVFSFVGDYGWAIVVFTLIIKILLLPFNIAQVRSTKKMNEISPKMKEIQEKFKSDPQKMNQKLSELYKEHNYRPTAGCLPALIQMPILIALYQVFRFPIQFVFVDPKIYAAVHKGFLWMTDISMAETHASLLMVGKFGIPVLAVLSGLTSYVQTKMISVRGSSNDMNQKMMTGMLPFFSAYITLTVPAALGIYWIISNVFTILQQYFMMKPLPATKEVK